jgi:hypothetical protein
MTGWLNKEAYPLLLGFLIVWPEKSQPNPFYCPASLGLHSPKLPYPDEAWKCMISVLASSVNLPKLLYLSWMSEYVNFLPGRAK